MSAKAGSAEELCLKAEKCLGTDAAGENGAADDPGASPRRDDIVVCHLSTHRSVTC